MFVVQNVVSFYFKLHRNILGFMLFLCFFIFLNCKSPQIKSTGDEHKSSKKLIDNVKEKYPFYNQMSAQFNLQGKIGEDEVVYFGTIKSIINKSNIEKSYLLINLKDTVFLADFYTLEIKNESVYQIDHLRDKKIKSSLSDYKWVEIFGNVIPFHFYFPILLGFPPKQIFNNEAVINEEAEKALYRSDIFETVVEFSAGYIKKIYFRTTLKKTCYL
ncbi:MAG: hypothetical protein OEZ13_01170 [Spirochaetia bacterium]|nr:hypothetical protein [Spirochaetia bacterium]